MRLLFFTLLWCTSCIWAQKSFEDDAFEKASAYIREYKSKGFVDDIEKFIPDKADILIDYAKKYFLEKKAMTQKAPKEVRDLECSACISGVGAIIFEYQTLGLTIDQIVGLLLPPCGLILGRDVCEGAINNYLPELLWIMDNHGLTGKKFCALVLQGKCGDWEEVNDWKIEIPTGKPPIEEPVLPPEGSSTYKVLHLSDVHLDLSYKVGTDFDCGKPMCCMNSTAMADDPAKAAGYWGSYACDLPYWTFEDMLKHIKEAHGEEIEYIMVTGDFPNHEVWGQSRSENLAHSKKMADLVSSVFPDKLILPGVGNHESFPCNSYPPTSLDVPEFAINWLYTELAQYYASWIPEDQRPQFVNSFTNRGYYSLKIRPGLRLVMVNPNACYGYNFWLNYDWKDNSGALTWLAETLWNAELNGEKVHIMSHIPPGNGDCLGAWGRNYARIVERFENTIRAQFFGHTHNDEFIMFYDSATMSRPLNLAFVTPSVTTFTGMNPAYTIYTVDGPHEDASYRVLDKEVYITRLDEANSYGPDVRPKYVKLYDARKDLEMASLFPTDYDKVVHRLAKDDVFYNKYFKYYNHDSEGRSEDSRRTVVCSMVTVSNIDDSKCVELMGVE